MSLRKSIVAQFARPHGPLGHLAGWILASRQSNVLRNRWTVDLLDLHDGDNVLEIGCGPGVALERCLSRAGVRVAGIDHSGVMIRQAEQRNRRAFEVGRLQLKEGTLDTLPAEWGPFDCIFAINLIQFVDRATFVLAARRALKPGGRLAITFQPRSTNATRANALSMASKLETLLSEHGFTSVRTEELDIKPVPAICTIGARSA